MTDETTASRRAFLKGGAILAAPLAVAVPGVAIAADESHARLRQLEDEAAIRALHREWLQRVNGRRETATLFVDARAASCLDGGVCSVAADREASDRIAIASDGRTAHGSFACLIETESRLPPENIFAQMALAQGGGITREAARHLVEADYMKAGDHWLIAKIETRAV